MFYGNLDLARAVMADRERQVQKAMRVRQAKKVRHAAGRPDRERWIIRFREARRV